MAATKKRSDGGAGCKAGSGKAEAGGLKCRGFLIHMTHYDPAWNKLKDQEERYDKETALDAASAAARAGMNLLIVDVKDAVVYRRLPELRRRYSVPMDELVEIAERAKELGLEVVPKMNFSLSPQHRHSQWFEPHQSSPPSRDFWRRGLAAVDEVVDAVKPRIVHVGMDEDDTRSPEEYREDLLRLHRELDRRGLRMAMWADVCHRWRAQQRWKEIPAIQSLPRDVILMPWHYGEAPREWIERLVGWGFEVVGAAGCWLKKPRRPKDRDPLENTRAWASAIRELGGAGVVVTNWMKCSRDNRATILRTIRLCGPILLGEGGDSNKTAAGKRNAARKNAGAD